MKKEEQTGGQGHSGFKRLFQEEVGTNLSNPLSFSDKDTAIQNVVWNFMTCDNVSGVSPPVKMLQLDGDQAVLVKYRLSTIQTLHKKVLAESDTQCSLSTFILTYLSISVDPVR